MEIKTPWERGCSAYILLRDKKQNGYQATLVLGTEIHVYTNYSTSYGALSESREKYSALPIMTDLWGCVHCGESSYDDYMVTDSVWTEAKIHRRAGRLHLTCLEERLCRHLRIEDFSEAPINDALKFGYRLGSGR